MTRRPKKERMARREISQERRAAYYLGMALMAIGFLVFLSTFVSFLSAFGGGGGGGDLARTMIVRPLLGMGMIAGGRLLMTLGSRGLAGSGVLLDPQRARRDVEPWSRMAGGVVQDALDEAGLARGDRGAARDLPFDEKLRRLHALHQDGILTDEEYAREKRELLDSD